MPSEVFRLSDYASRELKDLLEIIFLRLRKNMSRKSRLLLPFVIFKDIHFVSFLTIWSRLIASLVAYLLVTYVAMGRAGVD